MHFYIVVAPETLCIKFFMLKDSDGFAANYYINSFQKTVVGENVRLILFCLIIYIYYTDLCLYSSVYFRMVLGGVGLLK